MPRVGAICQSHLPIRPWAEDRTRRLAQMALRARRLRDRRGLQRANCS